MAPCVILPGYLLCMNDFFETLWNVVRGIHPDSHASRCAAESEARARQVAAFEAWRRRELLTWRRDVVQSETEQMAALEAAWAEREVTRQRDIADAVARVETLKAQLLQVPSPFKDLSLRTLLH